MQILNLIKELGHQGQWHIWLLNELNNLYKTAKRSKLIDQTRLESIVLDQVLASEVRLKQIVSFKLSVEQFSPLTNPEHLTKQPCEFI